MADDSDELTMAGRAGYSPPWATQHSSVSSLGCVIAKGRLARRCTAFVSALAVLACFGTTTPVSAEVPQTQPGLPVGLGANRLGAFEEPLSDGPTPVAIEAERGSTQVSIGCEHALYLHPDGTVWASGWNSFGQLGNGTSTDTATATQVAGLSDVVAVAAGCYHSMALESNGTVWLWGQPQEVTTGNPPDATCPRTAIPGPCFVHPTQWLGPTDITQIAAGLEDETALAADGSVYSGGQVGNAHLELPAPATDIAMQSYTAEAIANGQVYSWGSTLPPTPTLVPGITGVATALGGGAMSGYAVTSDGRVWAWGDDRYGQLGDGLTTAEYTTAIPVAGLPPIVSVAAGEYHAVALDANGNVWGWGDNVDGEIGSQVPQTVELLPSQIVGIEKALAITASNDSTIALVSASRVPTISAVSPDAGLQSGGASVTITGTDLAEASIVKFGSNAATSFAVRSPTEITATAPAGTGTVDITVSVGASTSVTSAADRFTYVPSSAAPVLKKLSPKSGLAAGGTSVAIGGTGFIGVTAVKFGASEASSYTVTSPTSITAISPASASGRVDVSVTTPNGTTTTSTSDFFTFGAPTVTGVSPATGPPGGGTSVRILGSGFATGANATIFKFGNAIATSVECDSTTMCAVVSPSHKAAVVEVKATVTGKTSKQNPPADDFTYG